MWKHCMLALLRPSLPLKNLSVALDHAFSFLNSLAILTIMKALNSAIKLMFCLPCKIKIRRQKTAGCTLLSAYPPIISSLFIFTFFVYLYTVFFCVNYYFWKGLVNFSLYLNIYLLIYLDALHPISNFPICKPTWPKPTRALLPVPAAANAMLISGLKRPNWKRSLFPPKSVFTEVLCLYFIFNTNFLLYVLIL